MDDVVALGAAAVVASVLGSGVGAAGADPKAGVTHLTCENGASYEVVVAGNGNWTPAHDSNSNTVFVPTWFGDFHGTVRDADGNVVDDFVEEGDVPKGQRPRTRATSSSARSASPRCPTGPTLNSPRASRSPGWARSAASRHPGPEAERERGLPRPAEARRSAVKGLVAPD